MSFTQICIYLLKEPTLKKPWLFSFLRVNVENQILKYGFTTCEITILENDDPGGVFEFSPSSRGPYSIKVGIWITFLNCYGKVNLSRIQVKFWIFFFFTGRGFCWTADCPQQREPCQAVSAIHCRTKGQ